jgi:hypothetical protein
MSYIVCKLYIILLDSAHQLVEDEISQIKKKGKKSGLPEA